MVVGPTARSPRYYGTVLAERNVSGSTQLDVLQIFAQVGRCRLTVSKSVLKAPIVSALEATVSYDEAFSNISFDVNLCRSTQDPAAAADPGDDGLFVSLAFHGRFYDNVFAGPSGCIILLATCGGRAGRRPVDSLLNSFSRKHLDNPLSSSPRHMISTRRYKSWSIII